MTSHISICDLTFSYRTEFSLTIPSLHIQKNEKVAFIGPSGCGKTTLISLIAGIYKPLKGSIVIDNQQIHSLSDISRRKHRLENIGFIFQNFELLEYLNVKENILLPFILNNTAISSTTLERLAYLLENTGLHNKVTHKPHQLSQGEKQRVAIARALIHKPQLIIADEPTGNLDPHNSTKIMDLLWQEIGKEITFVMVTHDHALLPKFDRVLEFKDNFELKEWK